MIFSPSAPSVSLPHPIINRLRFRTLGVALALILGLGGVIAPRLLAQYTFRTIAGLGTQPGNTNGSGGNTGVATQFSDPIGLVVSKSGVIYVSDNGNSLIRQISSAGVVSPFVGTADQTGENNGTTAGASVTFNLPQGLALDSAGNVYVADFGGNTIRKITPAGVVTTFAGKPGTVGTIDGQGVNAQFHSPTSVAVDSSGNVFVTDSGNNLIRKITADGTVTTFAGTTGVNGHADGKGTAASFFNPRGIACDTNNNLYVADTGNNLIRKITSDGTVSTLAGMNDTYGSVDGTGSAARFSIPNGVAVDSAGNVYVADSANATIRKVTPAGVVTTLAGLAGAEGRIDGTGSAARFNSPMAVSLDTAGNIYVADYDNELIRKVSPAGVVTTVSGTGGVAGLQDGTGYLLNPTLFQYPTQAVPDGTGSVLVTDSGNNSIRKIAPDGTVSLFAGATGGAAGATDGQGAAALFRVPAGLARDGAGNFYIADSANQLIRKLASDGTVSTIAGTVLVSGSADGAGTAASFNNPSAVAVDAAGNVYVADYSNHAIRRIDPAGNVTTIAGTAGQPGSADGVGAAARFFFPRSLAIDGAGNLWVTDSGNETIRKLAPNGTVTTVAGSAGVSGTADGSGSAARFNNPVGIAVDAAGNVFIADASNSTIRLLTAGGTVSTVGGTAGTVGSADGTGSAALFNHPTGISIDRDGNILIADNRNNTIRKGYLNDTTAGQASNDYGASSSGGGSGGSGGSSGGGSGSGGSGSGGTGTGTGSGAYETGSTGVGFFTHPTGILADGLGNYYVCDSAGNCIRKFNSAGTVETYAGKSGSSGSADGSVINARFNNPTGIAIDSAGILYVCDTGNNTIRKIATDGTVSTLAGASGQSGSTDGTGTGALFNGPTGIAIYSATGDVYVSDSNNSTIRKITSAGVVTTFAGTALAAGEANGVGTAARFNHPTGLVFDIGGNLNIADTYNNTIRRMRIVDLTTLDAAGNTIVLAPAGNVITIAGSAGLNGAYDGVGEYALFNLPQGLTADASGFLYVADTGNSCIRRIALNGAVNTLAGIPTASGKRNGPGEQALFNQPQALAPSSAGTLLVSDTGNSVLRQVVFGAGGANDTNVSTVSLVEGSLTTTTTSTPVIDPTTGQVIDPNGGGGAPSLWFIAALGGLSLIRRFRNRKE